MKSLEGKVAWITGAGTGIGRAGAMALAEAGAVVVLSGRRAAQLEDVKARIEAAGGKAEAAPLDIADVAACDALVADVVARHKRLDIVVNSAGLNVAKRKWREIAHEDWRKIFEVDLGGAYNVCQAALRPMRAQRDGIIVNVSSMASQRVGGVSGFAYTTAKTGLNALNESINHEHCHLGIRATAFCPGEVATEILDRRPTPVSDEDKARMLQEEDTGRMIRFIAETPAHVCLNEVQMTPTWNRGYIGAADRSFPRDD